MDRVLFVGCSMEEALALCPPPGSGPEFEFVGCEPCDGRSQMRDAIRGIELESPDIVVIAFRLGADLFSPEFMHEARARGTFRGNFFMNGPLPFDLAESLAKRAAVKPQSWGGYGSSFGYRSAYDDFAYRTRF